MGQVFALDSCYVLQLTQGSIFVGTASIDMRFRNPQYTIDILWVKFVS